MDSKFTDRAGWDDDEYRSDDEENGGNDDDGDIYVPLQVFDEFGLPQQHNDIDMDGNTSDADSDNFDNLAILDNDN